MNATKLDGGNSSAPLLRALILEDNPRDAKLTVAALERGGYAVQFEVRDSLELFRERLEEAEYDVILADYNLRNWTAMDALEILKRSGKDVPLIIVTGTLGDEAAVECIKQGAADYILKDRAARLPMAVRRVLEAKRLRDERRQAEEEFRKLSRAVEQSPVSVVITDREGNIEYVNPKFTELTGYTLEEVRGQNPRILKSGETPPEEYRKLWETIASGGEWRGEFHNRKKDGTLFWERASISPIRDASGTVTHFLGVKEDITAQKLLMQQFLQARKMEAVGRLAGGIAHDFNNLLTVINGYSELLLTQTVEEPLRRHGEEIKKAGERAALLTRQLLAFSRQQVLEPQVLDLNSVVTSTEKMLRRVIGEDIELATVLASDLGRIKADPGQLGQVIMNLAVNSRDAMPQGGKLTLATANVELGEAHARCDGAIPPGPYVMLSVSDTGGGMNPETQAHIFEPFFTTKEKGKGTGLGLATVYGIVQQSGGSIECLSELERGTTFRVYLPRLDQAPVEAVACRAEPACTRGTETILLVEDEESVRTLVTKVLLSRGYAVLEARHGEQALAVAREHDGPIHLLLSDVVMPVMSGPDLAERLVPQHHEMKVLFMSGYTDDAILRHGVRDANAAYLQKPFSPDALASKVRSLLDAVSVVA